MEEKGALGRSGKAWGLSWCLSDEGERCNIPWNRGNLSLLHVRVVGGGDRPSLRLQVRRERAESQLPVVAQTPLGCG